MPSKKSMKARKTRRQRGGYYGASGAIIEGSGGPAGMRWGTETEVPAPAYAQGGARRRRGKKSKKSTKRKMRGGSKFGATYAGYQGTGSRGHIDVVGGTHKPGAPQLGRFNDFGAHPGDFSKFEGLAPGSK
jgi:hypothetical protein